MRNSHISDSLEEPEACVIHQERQASVPPHYFYTLGKHLCYYSCHFYLPLQMEELLLSRSRRSSHVRRSLAYKEAAVSGLGYYIRVLVQGCRVESWGFRGKAGLSDM